MPFKVPTGSPLRVDGEGRASCMELKFRLHEMTVEQQDAHLAAHAESCDDGPEFSKVCPVCVPLRREYQARVLGEGV
jgi:hypothetical protein